MVCGADKVGSRNQLGITWDVDALICVDYSRLGDIGCRSNTTGGNLPQTFMSEIMVLVIRSSYIVITVWAPLLVLFPTKWWEGYRLSTRAHGRTTSGRNQFLN